MRVLVTGGRDFADRDQIFEELDKLHGEGSEISMVIVGCNDGSDRLAAEWAKARGVAWFRYASNWPQHQPDICLAFHGAETSLLKIAKGARVYIETIPLRVRCDHINPATYKHSKDTKGNTIATCPHCGKFMGYVHGGGSL